MNFAFDAIGIVHSCYKEKFTIPRQAGLVTEATAEIELFSPYNHPDMVKGLEGFSHIWISFVFNQHINKGFNHLVSPPRLNGETSYGVYATRSPYRPNPIGLSVVILENIEFKDGTIFLHIKGGDLLDQSPVVDIKPYLQYSDSLTDTRNGFVDKIQDNHFHLIFSQQAEQQIMQAQQQLPNIRLFIEQLLSQDPRAHYQKKIKNTYSVKVYNFDLRWNINGKEIEVLALDKLY